MWTPFVVSRLELGQACPRVGRILAEPPLHLFPFERPVEPLQEPKLGRYPVRDPHLPIAITGEAHEPPGQRHHHGLVIRLCEQVAKGLPLKAVAESLLAPFEDVDHLMTVIMEDPQADRTARPGLSVGPVAALVVLDQHIGDVRKRLL